MKFVRLFQICVNPDCKYGGLIDGDRKFCPLCGGMVIDECPHCRKEHRVSMFDRKDAIFCDICGKSLKLQPPASEPGPGPYKT